MATKSLFLRIDSSQESISPVWKLQSDTLTKRERERPHVLDEKSIPASQIEAPWEMGDSIPHSVPTWFLLSL